MAGPTRAALAWLADTLAARGKSLYRAMLVMPGRIASANFLNAGENTTVSIGGLGEARLTVM